MLDSMISIVIPTLNEAEQLPKTLGSAQAGKANVDFETVVVDGGSIDATVDVALGLGARVEHAPAAGRALQMNLGAAVARGKILLFLHADTWLNQGSLESIRVALQAPEVVGGAFERSFNLSSAFLRWTCRLAAWRSRWLGWFLGDQGIFVRRSVFEALGGFPDWPRFEDLEFSRRLARRGRVVTLRPPVVSSGRRFQAMGPVRRTLVDAWLTLGYFRRSGARAQPSRRP